jgi:hypothetical protein
MVNPGTEDVDVGLTEGLSFMEKNPCAPCSGRSLGVGVCGQRPLDDFVY